MQILVINSGGSSLKFQLFELDEGDFLSLARGVVKDFGPSALCQGVVKGVPLFMQRAVCNHHDAALLVMDCLHNHGLPTQELAGVGYRVVHGGDQFRAPVLISDSVLASLNEMQSLAPLHNPASLQTMRALRDLLGMNIPMVAVFDTSFFQHLPDAVNRYALPDAWAKTFGVKRYGFHGIAHACMVEQTRPAQRVIT